MAPLQNYNLYRTRNSVPASLVPTCIAAIILLIIFLVLPEFLPARSANVNENNSANEKQFTLKPPTTFQATLSVIVERFHIRETNFRCLLYYIPSKQNNRNPQIIFSGEKNAHTINTNGVAGPVGTNRATGAIGATGATGSICPAGPVCMTRNGISL
ncbi:MAG: hypothetical protein HY064_07330 [Bacteroidetes bacterium]|nr:hypothetical protein [Bacteroidota bacterium]